MHPGEGYEIGQLMGVKEENALELCTCSLLFYRPTGSKQLVETTTYTCSRWNTLQKVIQVLFKSKKSRNNNS